MALRTGLYPLLHTRPSPRSSSASLQPRRHITYSSDREELDDCDYNELYRPILSSTTSREPTYREFSPDLTLIRRAIKIDYWFASSPRLQGTGLKVGQNSSVWPRSSDSRMSEPTHPEHNSFNFLRLGCLRGLFRRWSPVLEIKARKLCAETKDPRYPPIYHTVEGQAQALYLLGLVDLERDPIWRQSAWYILLIAAGLGHLDAALVLHRLDQIDPRFSPGQEQRAVVAKAALAKSDWRAIVAHCEYMISGINKHRRNRDLDRRILDRALTALTEAMDMTRTLNTQYLKRSDAPSGHLDAAVVRTIKPPYRVLLDITTNSEFQRMSPEKVSESFRLAALKGALGYNDPEAAWLYVKYVIDNNIPRSKDWVTCAEIAIASGNEDACFELAKYQLEKDGWYPTLAAKVLSGARTRNEERLKRSQTEDDFRTVTEDEKNDEIVNSKNDKLLGATRGLEWMEIAAELHCNDGAKMLNRYAIVIGLLRQNGFLQHGLEVLHRAQDRVRTLALDHKQKSVVLARLAEIESNWDKRRVHQLLPPETIDQLLNPKPV